MKKIALFGGTFNPPHNGHVEIAQMLAKEFDEVVIIPCGPRREKPSADMVEPIYRAVMCDMAFGNIPKARVDLSDLERDDYTRTHELVKRFSEEGNEVWVVVGTDLLQPKNGASSEIYTWEKGERLWSMTRFAVIERPGFPPRIGDLPNFKIFQQISNLSSSTIRQMIFRRQSIGEMVPLRVESYIHRHRLYTGRAPGTDGGLMEEDEPKFLIFADKFNQSALIMAETLQHLEDKENPNRILVLGGDGTMFRAIRALWRKRLPFFGVNLGHEGFLLNDKRFLGNYNFKQMKVWQVPLLTVRVRDKRGWGETIAFNEAWMERDGGHMAQIQVWLNGNLHEKCLKCDSVLVTTAAGSTAYAMRLGVTPMYWFIPSLAMAASAVWDPPYQRSWNLEISSKIKLLALETDRGPVRVFADGVKYENVLEARIRVSRTAAVELAFHPDHDVTERVRNIHKTLKEGK